MVRTSYIRRDDKDDIHLVFSSLKQQSAGKHIAPLGHIILFLSTPVFAHTL